MSLDPPTLPCSCGFAHRDGRGEPAPCPLAELDGIAYVQKSGGRGGRWIRYDAATLRARFAPAVTSGESRTVGQHGGEGSGTISVDDPFVAAVLSFAPDPSAAHASTDPGAAPRTRCVDCGGGGRVSFLGATETCARCEGTGEHRPLVRGADGLWTSQPVP